MVATKMPGVDSKSHRLSVKFCVDFQIRGSVLHNIMLLCKSTDVPQDIVMDTRPKIAEPIHYPDPVLKVCFAQAEFSPIYDIQLVTDS